MNSAYEWVNKRTRPAKPNNKTMKYRVKTDRMPFKKGTEFILDEDINGVEFNPYGSEYPAIGREMLQAYPNDFEIVDQTPTIEINGYEVELHDDCVKVGCEVLSPQFIKELNVILQKHGAEFIVSGNDISSQIRQIAKHYGNMAGEPAEFNDTFNVSGMGFSATNMWKAND